MIFTVLTVSSANKNRLSQISVTGGNAIVILSLSVEARTKITLSVSCAFRLVDYLGGVVNHKLKMPGSTT